MRSRRAHAGRLDPDQAARKLHDPAARGWQAVGGDPRTAPHIAEVAPAGFFETEFYLSFYKAVAVLDEFHLAVPLSEGRSTQVFIERETTSAPFSREEIASLDELASLLMSLVSQHWAWRDGVGGVIRNIRPGALTARDVEVIEMSLRGHASKVIGVSSGSETSSVNRCINRFTERSRVVILRWISR